MGVRNPDKGEREKEREREGGKEGERERWRERGWQGEGRHGRELGTNPGVRVSRDGAHKKADARRKELRTGRKKGNPRRWRVLPAPSPEASGPHGDRRCSSWICVGREREGSHNLG